MIIKRNITYHTQTRWMMFVMEYQSILNCQRCMHTKWVHQKSLYCFMNNKIITIPCRVSYFSPNNVTITFCTVSPKIVKQNWTHRDWRKPKLYTRNQQLLQQVSIKTCSKVSLIIFRLREHARTWKLFVNKMLVIRHCFSVLRLLTLTKK